MTRSRRICKCGQMTISEARAWKCTPRRSVRLSLACHLRKPQSKLRHPKKSPKKIPKSFPLAKQPPNFESTSYSSSTTIAITTTTTKYWTTLANFSTDCTINIRNPVHEASPTTQKENSNEQYTHVVDRLLAIRIRLNPSCSDQNCASRATKRTTTLSPPLSAIYVFVGHFLLCIHTHQNCRNMFPKHANK